MYVFEKGAPPSSSSATAPQRTGSKTHRRGAAYSPEVFPVRAKRAMPPYGTAEQRNFIDRWCSVGLCCQWVNGLKHMVPKFRKLWLQWRHLCEFRHKMWFWLDLIEKGCGLSCLGLTKRLDQDTGLIDRTKKNGLRDRMDRPDRETGPRDRTERLDQGTWPKTDRPDQETGLQDRTTRPDQETGLQDRTARPNQETGPRDRNEQHVQETKPRHQTKRPN